MRAILAVGFGAVGVALLFVVAHYAALGVMPMNPVTLGWTLFFDSGPIAKLAFLLFSGVLLLTLISIVAEGVRDALGLFGGLCPAMGVLAGGYSGYITYTAAERLQVTDPRITAPSFAEAVFVVSAGFLAGAAAWAVLVIFARRR